VAQGRGTIQSADLSRRCGERAHHCPDAWQRGDARSEPLRDRDDDYHEEAGQRERRQADPA
jgi:hypothetical protein